MWVVGACVLQNSPRVLSREEIARVTVPEAGLGGKKGPKKERLHSPQKQSESHEPRNSD